MIKLTTKTTTKVKMTKIKGAVATAKPRSSGRRVVRLAVGFLDDGARRR
jgi:hypothetical protein